MRSTFSISILVCFGRAAGSLLLKVVRLRYAINEHYDFLSKTSRVFTPHSENKSWWKHCEKRENASNQYFFLPVLTENISFSVKKFVLSSTKVAPYSDVSQTSPGFTRLQNKSFENTAGKGKIARNEQFLLFSVFSIYLENLLSFIIKFEIVVSKLFPFGRV